MRSATTITSRLQQIAARQPDAIAASGGGTSLTYGELNKAANRLARLIVEHEVPADAPVAFQLPRGPRQLIAMLAILKAGAPYLPLDASYPVARRKFMLEDSRCPLILTAGDGLPAALRAGRTHIDLGRLADSDLSSDDSDLADLDPHALAYVIYTSGTTDEPKGVLIEHHSVVLLAQSLAAYYGRGAIGRQYQFFSLCFDGSVWEIFLSLLNGIELFVDPHGPGELEPDELLDMLDHEGVDSFMTTPSYLARATPRPHRNLKTITVGGEPCPPRLARDWSASHRFVNAYGPTECAVVAATVGDVDGSGDAMSIGRPLAHVEVLVVADGALVPDGHAGEICIAGPAVGRGYLRRPALTAASFVPTIGSADACALMYRTGDVGRRRPDGEIEHLGRSDDQVKIRGFRVQLSEVETHLRGLAQVGDAAVVAFRGQAQKLMAGFVRSVDGELGVEALRRRLHDRLAPHMVPLILTRVDELPTLPSGKVDRSRLRDDAAELYRQIRRREQRRDPDDIVASLWREALGRTTVDGDDDFFDLGGQSVLAAEVVSRTRTQLGIELPLRALFEHSTLAAYSAVVAEAVGARSG